MASMNPEQSDKKNEEVSERIAQALGKTSTDNYLIDTFVRTLEANEQAAKDYPECFPERRNPDYESPYELVADLPAQW